MGRIQIRKRDFAKVEKPKPAEKVDPPSSDLKSLERTIAAQAAQIEALTKQLQKKPQLVDYDFEIIRGSDKRLIEVKAVAKPGAEIGGRGRDPRTLLN